MADLKNNLNTEVVPEGLKDIEAVGFVEDDHIQV